MAEYVHLSDAAILSRLGDRILRQRLARNLTQEALAKEAGVSKRTVLRLESGASTQLTNLVRVLRVLDLHGNLDSLVPMPLPSPIEQLRAQRKQRSRASGSRGRSRDSGTKNPPTWTWGDE